jgi:hypothetical protein
MLPSASNNVSCQVNQITMDINDILQRSHPHDLIKQQNISFLSISKYAKQKRNDAYLF